MMKIAPRYLYIILLSLCCSASGFAKTFGLDSTAVFSPDSTRLDSMHSENTTIPSGRFNQGFIISPEQLIKGKVPNVQITRENGPLGSSSAIYIRGNSTFLDENQPLFVIDGLPLPDWDPKGFFNKTNFINPQDIESIKVIKGGPETSRYGIRGGNGVIEINTKKGTRGFHVHYNGSLAYQYVSRYYPVLSASGYKKVIHNLYGGSTFEQNAIGVDNTDWQKEIYHNAISQSHYLSISGKLDKAHLPFRISYNRMDHNTFIKDVNNKKNYLSASCAPSFLKKHLELNLQWNSFYSKNKFPYYRLPINAIRFNPTFPVKQGGFYTEYNNVYMPNPVDLINNYNTLYKSKQYLWNASLIYKLHFAPAFKIEIGARKEEMKSKGQEENYYPGIDSLGNAHEFNFYDNHYSSTIYHSGIIFRKYWPNAKLNLLACTRFSTQLNKNGERVIDQGLGERYNFYTEKVNYLTAEVKFSYNNEFTLHTALTKNKTSIDHTTNYFPGASLSWNIVNDGFIPINPFLNKLTLRYAYSSAGTIDHTKAIYGGYFDPKATLYTRIESHELNITFALFKDHISGTLTGYKKTSNHPYLEIEPSVFGQGGVSFITTTGQIKNDGLEVSLTEKLLNRKDISWSLSENMSKNYYSENDNDIPRLITYIGSQLYDTNGAPIEGAYSPNASDIINFNASQRLPDFIAGLNSELQFHAFDFSFSGRFNRGNKIFNRILSSYANYESLGADNPSKEGLNIPSVNIHYFRELQPYSSYYLEKGDFLKLDYVSLGYTLPVWKTKIRCYATWQDILLWTNYKGLNPEVRRGIDFNPYPNTSTVSLGISVDL